MDQNHAWANLPDMARTAVMLCENAERFTPFEEFGFEGYTLTGAALVDQIEKATGVAQKVSSFPWPIIWLLGLFKANIRDVYEMRHFWRIPHRIDGSKLAGHLPDYQPTSLSSAFEDLLHR